MSDTAPALGMATDDPGPGSPIVQLEGLSRSYRTPAAVIEALKNIDLEVGTGQMVAVRGRSGSGKTTLLNMIGGLDRPTEGVVKIAGEDITSFGDEQLVHLRRERLAFVFQAFGLIPILTAAENVEVPLRLSGTAASERRERVSTLLELVGLGDRAAHRPHELSGGEQQRVALARALANRPQLLLADEPTGQLDSRTGRAIMNLLLALVRSEGVTAIVATHDPEIIDLADRTIELLDGEIVADSLTG